MKMKPIALVVAGMAAAGVLSAPVFAAKTALSDAALDNVVGQGNNTYLFNSGQSATVSMDEGSANIQFDWYQWSDNHKGDTSTNKGANDQSGNSSTVQQSIQGSANALIWGSAGQNVLLNSGSGNTIGVSQNNMSYGVFAAGGF
jgi:hypothetical protein